MGKYILSPYFIFRFYAQGFTNDHFWGS